MRIETFVRILSRMRKTFGLIEGEHHGEPLVSLTTVHLSTAFDPLTFGGPFAFAGTRR